MNGGAQLLDEVNVRLLHELQADPRITMSALARQVGMSAPAVTERVQRLEQAGVITGYSLRVDPTALGYPVAVFVRIKITTGRLDRFAAFVDHRARGGRVLPGHRRGLLPDQGAHPEP